MYLVEIHLLNKVLFFFLLIWHHSVPVNIPNNSNHLFLIVSGFMWTKQHWGQVFYEYFGFHCQSFHQFIHHHNHPGPGTIGLLVTAVPSGPNWTPRPTIPIQCNRVLLPAGRPRGRSSIPDRVKNFLNSTSSRPALGLTRWTPGAFSPGGK
jgi:hypothetical protein